jgi:hypothetical protein
MDLTDANIKDPTIGYTSWEDIEIDLGTHKVYLTVKKGRIYN